MNKILSVVLLISFIFPFAIALAQTSYSSKNVLSPLVAVVSTQSNQVQVLLQATVSTQSNDISESIKCHSVVKLKSAPASALFIASVTPNTVSVGEKVTIKLAPDPRYKDTLGNLSQYSPRISILLQEEYRWVLQNAQMAFAGDSFVYEYVPTRNGTYTVYIEVDSGSLYLGNAFVAGPSSGVSPTGGTNYWLIGLVVLAVVLAVMLLRRRSSSYIRYIGGYRYFVFLFHIFKRNVFYVLDLINGRW